MSRIAYVKPSITKLEIDMVTAAATNGWGSNSYSYVTEFENRFASKIGTRHAIATSSCTGALHLGLKAIGVSPGDEIILADTNWVATLAPISYLGAKPIFVDIQEDSWCIDVNKVRDQITPKTKALIATHLYGNLCDMDQLASIAREFHLTLIEDAAEALGSAYKGKHAGSIGHFGVFSFHGTKTITTGEGGMLTTDSLELSNSVRVLNNHGRDPNETRQFWPAEIGYKYKMTNIQAALGIGQLDRFDELIDRKREILAYYLESLSSYPEVRLNIKQDSCVSGAWMPNAVFTFESGIRREELVDRFTAADIDARVFFWPLSDLGFYETKSHSSNSRELASRSINLPSFHDMTLADQDQVLEVLVAAIYASRSRRGIG